MLNLKTIWENIFDKIKAVYGLHRIGPDSKRIQELKDNNIPNYVIWMFYRAGTDINNTDSGKNKAGQIYRGKLTATKGAKTAIDYLVNLLDYVGLGTEQKYLLNLFKTSVVAYRYIQVSLDDCNIKEKYDKYIEENTEEVEKSLEELNDLIFEKIKEMFDEFMASSEENAQSLIDEFGVDKMQITKEKATQVLTVLISLALLSIDSKTKLPCDTAYVDKINFDKLKLGLKKYISEEFKNNSESDSPVPKSSNGTLSSEKPTLEKTATIIFEIENNSNTVDLYQKSFMDSFYIILEKYIASDDIDEIEEIEQEIKNQIQDYFDNIFSLCTSKSGSSWDQIRRSSKIGFAKIWEYYEDEILSRQKDSFIEIKTDFFRYLKDFHITVQLLSVEISLKKYSLTQESEEIRKEIIKSQIRRLEKDFYSKNISAEGKEYDHERMITLFANKHLLDNTRR